MNLNKYIFREYDIRGKVDDDFPSEVVISLGKGFGTYIKRNGGREIALSGDVRESTPLLISQFKMSSGEISLTANGKIILTGDSPYIDVKINLDESNIKYVSALIPRKMSPKLSTWATNSILDGKILSGEVVYKGYGEDLIFENPRSNFKALFNLGDINLKYHPEWPSINKLAAEVVVEAENELEANDLAHNVDLDCFENADYVQGSFDIDFNMIEEWTEEDEKFWSGSASKGQTNMKVGDKVKVVANELQGVIIELFPAVDDWKETAMVSFPNGKQVEYELIDLEVK